MTQWYEEGLHLLAMYVNFVANAIQLLTIVHVTDD